MFVRGDYWYFLDITYDEIGPHISEAECLKEIEDYERMLEEEDPM
jgi:hypothetical protein